tara:strand:- start:4376 stop:4900 length:525 start_codon:yes stop_codon:yes gene_type:complete
MGKVSGTRNKRGVLEYRDSQKTRVYNAERAVLWVDEILGQKITLEQATELIHQGYKRYRPRTIKRPSGLPKVVRGPAGHIAYYNQTGNKISLPTWAWTPAVALHELAHSITGTVCVRYEEGFHGPMFVRTLVDLIKWYSGKDVAPEFKERKVKVASTTKAMKPLYRGHATKLWT